ncbi:hypothetical protein K435DRAFT_310718 [Dendrothele bispora CBS 962.96]|uniref:Uncharacterized protein n=1 Tax=Dendrothele bispora (strain CBS 962.96) TaxID=1314807 RepID=A0A4S8MKE0_DENBC|nr:hypothetical protein K435DRAFT_310718 [Dendrothele bispora CBS 962.96]
MARNSKASGLTLRSSQAASLLIVATLVFLLFVLSLVSVISEPLDLALDLMHIGFTNLGLTGDTSASFVKELRIGIWGYCFTSVATNTSSCIRESPGYRLVMTDIMASDVTIAGPTLSRSLLLHPIRKRSTVFVPAITHLIL